ncbi:hypothetical protein [Phormidium tenue]|uniref:Uncharacterized protein n=1 Tax=Phormidium tenue FACHB-1050 TaxID=2692857 RepID=A0ABR8C7K5_9CYAN|nr:hypothetical protein [Phormidium tenue]MBD2316644.1 hypothetical protein [Phormidium tenue FACHB-1050]
MPVTRIRASSQSTKVVTLSSSSNATAINSDITDIGVITLTESTTFSISGTPFDQQILILKIKSASSLAIAFSSDFEAASSLTLPSATTGSNKIDAIVFRWSTAQSKWVFDGTTIGTIPTAADGSIEEVKLATAFRVKLYNKNYFKNPNFKVIQGTASGTLANSLALPTASLGYLGETEWIVAASGGTPAYTFSAANESVTFTGAASTTAIYLAQRLESRDVTTLANKLANITISAEISNSLLTSVTWEIFRATTTNDTHGTIASPTQTSLGSGTWTVTSTLTRYSATITLPALAARGLEVRLRVGAQTSGTWVVARLQLEEGSLATNFNCDDFGEELRKCQRHYQKQAPQGISPVATFSAGSSGTNAYIIGSGGSAVIAAIPLLVPMFTAPSMVFSDATGAIGVVTAFTSGSWFNGQGATLWASSDNSISLLSGTSTYIHCRYQASAHIP